MKSIIFDFDGVILDTFDFHYQHICQYTKLDISKEDYKNVLDGNIYQYPQWSNINWLNYRSFIYNEFIQQEITPTIKEELSELSQKSDLHIITSGSEKNISCLLDNNNLLPYFKEVL